LSLGQKTFFVLFFIFLCSLFGAPIGALLVVGQNIAGDQFSNWQFILNDLLPVLISNTFGLCLGTVLLGSLLGIIQAVAIEYIADRWKLFFEVLLTLPLTLPLYIYSFAYIGLFEWSSPLSRFIRFISLGTIDSLSIKNLWGAIFIFSLALYPYVFLFVRLSLRGRWQMLYRSAIIMGKKPFWVWIDLLKGLSSKAILSGAVVICMESLSDFGGVSFIGLNTFTTAIYMAWSSFYSVEMAARLGLLLFVVIIPLVTLENRLSFSYDESDQKREVFRSHFCALSFVLISLIFTIVLPGLQLGVWFFQGHHSDHYQSVLAHLGQTLGLSLFVAFAMSVLSLITIIILRKIKSVKLKKMINYLFYGYAVPGNLIAIAFLALGSYFWSEYSLSWAIILLMGALCVKFMRSAIKQHELGDQSISDDIERSAHLFSENNSSKFFKSIYFPMMRPSLIYGFLLIFIEVVKELPLIMILRPAGFNTLSTKVYEYTSEGEWELACLYALPLVLTCVFFHVIVTKKSRVL